MKLSEKQLRVLWDLTGLESKGYSYDLNSGVFAEILASIEEYFGDDINLAYLATKPNDYQKQRLDFLKIIATLEDAERKSKQLRLDPVRLYLVYEEVRQSVPPSILRQLHAQNSNLGIQEKFLMRLLTDHECLTDLDIERMILFTNTKDRIKITRFNSTDLGMALHFAREKGIHEIGFMINAGSEGFGQGVHWFALTIKVNTNSRTIEYLVEDGFPIGDEHRQKLSRVIEAALNYDVVFKVAKVAKAYRAYPGWKIRPGNFQTFDTQPDIYSCGYRAFHRLCQNPVLRGNNELAINYSDVPHQSDALCASFFSIQISNLPEENRVHAYELALLMESLLSELNEKSLEPLKEGEKVSQGSAKVTEKLNDYSAGFAVQQFPGPDAIGLTQSDYCDYFTELNKKLIQTEGKLKTLILSPCDRTCLDALKTYCASNPQFRVEKIELVLSNPGDQASFLLKLQSTLYVLSNSSIASITFEHAKGCLDALGWEQCSKFIGDRKIALEIELPVEYQRSDLQRRIDKSVSVNQKEKSSRKAEIAVVTEKAQKESTKKRTKRTRGRDIVAGISIEMAQEKEVQVEVEAAVDAAVKDDKATDGDDSSQLMTFKQFEEKLRERRFKIPNGCYLISVQDLKSRWNTWFGDIENDGKVVANPNLRGATGRACEALLQYADQFKLGIDFTRLPAGFVATKDPQDQSKIILDYQSFQAEIQKSGVLSVQCKAQNQVVAVAFDVYENISKNLTPKFREYIRSLNEGDYDRNVVFMLRKHCPTLSLLSEDSQKALWIECQKDGKFDTAHFDFIVQNLRKIAETFPNGYDKRIFPASSVVNKAIVEIAKNYINQRIKEPNVLLLLLEGDEPIASEAKRWLRRMPNSNHLIEPLIRLYASHGAAGLTQLFQQWDQIRPEVIDSLFRSFFPQLRSFEVLLSSEYQNAIKVINSFDPQQITWWNALAQQHCAALSIDDFPSCVSAFQQFYAEISQLGLNLTPAVEFQNAHNMKIVMSRMLIIINKVKKEDRSGLWSRITGLPFQSNAAVWAVTYGKCDFVVPEMQCVPEQYYVNGQAGYGTHFWHQNPNTEDWHGIALKPDPLVLAQMGQSQEKRKWRNINDKYYLDADSLEVAKKNFFRFLSKRPRNYSLSFYQQAILILEKKLESVEEPVLKSKLFYRLVAVLASSTTLKNQTSFELPERVLKQWDTLLNYIIYPSLPSIAKFLSLKTVKKEVQDSLSDILFGFQTTLSLEYLEELFSYVNSRIEKAGLRNHNQVYEDLKGKCDRLEMLIKVFSGNYLSQGRRFSPKGGDTLITYVDFCWMLYELDTKRYKEYQKRSGDLQEYAVADGAVQLIVGLISTFNITTEQQLLQIFKVFDSVVNPKNRPSRDTVYYRLMIDVLTVLLGVNSNLVKGKPLTSDDLCSIVAETGKLIHQNSDFFKNKEVTEHDSSIERMNLFGNYLLKRFSESLAESYVKSIMFFNERSIRRVQGEIDSILGDQTQEVRSEIKNLISPYTVDIQQDSRFLTYLKNVLISLNPDQRLKFCKMLANDNILRNANFFEMCELLKLISESRTNIVGEFMYLCERDDAKVAESLIHSAIIYLRKIVLFLPSLPGLSKFEALPLAASILLRENKDFIGKDPHLMTPGVRLWEEVINVLESSEKMSLEEFERRIEDLSERAPDKETCGSLLGLLNEAKQLNEVARKKSKGALLGMIVDVIEKISEAIGGEKKAPPPRAFSMRLLAMALTESQKNKMEEFKYPATFFYIMQEVSSLTLKYPIIKMEYLNFVTAFVGQYHNPHTALIVATWFMLTSVEQACHDIDNPEAMRSLLFWFTQEGRSSQELLDLFDRIKEPQIRNVLFPVIAKLLDNDHEITPELLDTLYQLVKRDSQVIGKVNVTYNFAPFPTLQTFFRWLDQPEKFEKNREDYRRVPCPRDPNNGFVWAEADVKRQDCVGIEFSDHELDSLLAMTGIYRDSTVEELLSEFYLYQRSDKPDLIKLLAVTAELLYRAKGTPQEGVKMANSFEINTTQYLAILAELKGGEHVTSGIGTSEGKSRIMMIVNACQFAQGKTVDFLTSDLSLSKRDFLSAQAFFKLIGAESSLIYSSSPFALYKMKGMNYSDRANLSLFRNRARSLGLIRLVLNPNPKLRSLSLDESDLTYFDSTEQRCNFSGESDDSIRGMEWVYPLLVGFFLKNDPRVSDAFYNDVEVCTDIFLEFARSRCSAKDFTRLESLTRAQLETWQTSADVAIKLKHNINYIVQGDVLLNTSSGPKMASDILLIVQDRVALGSKYSDGIQQCLTAYLNLLRLNPSEESALCVEIRGFQHDFNMEPEKKIIYSSTSQDFLDDYEEGSLKASSGTPGALIEQMEASSSMAHKGPESVTQMRFITIPRHKGLKRVDLPPILVRSHAEKLKKIRAAIYEALMNGQGIAFICKNDEESLKLYNELLEMKIAGGSFQRIYSGLLEKEEAAMVKVAGKPGMITVSTGMIGRGVDVEAIRKTDAYRYLEEQYPGYDFMVMAAKQGLKIRAVFLPTTRDMEQFFGRSGRKGEPGDAQLILELSDLPVQVDPNAPDIETTIAALQVGIDRHNQCKRLVLNTYGRFRRLLNEQYFGVLGEKGINRYWAKFQTQADQAWKEIWTQIRDRINSEKPDPLIIEQYLNAYQKRAENYWRELCGNITSDSGLNEFSLNDTVPVLSLDRRTQYLLSHFDLMDSLAPIQLKQLYALFDQTGGCVKAFHKFEILLNRSKTDRDKLTTVAGDKASEGKGPVGARYALLHEFACSDESDILPRLLDAYCNIEEPSDHHALVVLQFIVQFMENPEILMVGDVNKIYETITSALAVKNSPYLKKLEEILIIAFNHQSQYRLAFFNTETETNKEFFDALKMAYERRILSPAKSKKYQ